MNADRLTPQREAEIATRAGYLYEYVSQHNEDWDELAGEDVPALLAELAAVRAERDQAQARAAELEGQPADTYPPAMPWAKLFDREDLADFLVELGQAAVGCDDVTEALGEVESVCGTWRLIGEAQHAHNTAPGPGAVDGAVA